MLREPPAQGPPAEGRRDSVSRDKSPPCSRRGGLFQSKSTLSRHRPELHSGTHITVAKPCRDRLLAASFELRGAPAKELSTPGQSWRTAHERPLWRCVQSGPSVWVGSIGGRPPFGATSSESDRRRSAISGWRPRSAKTLNRMVSRRSASRRSTHHGTAHTGPAALHDGWLGLVHRANPVSHALAAGTRFGALVPLLATMILLDGPLAREAATAVRRFSTVGHAVVAPVPATGALGTALVIEHRPAPSPVPTERCLSPRSLSWRRWRGSQSSTAPASSRNFGTTGGGP